MKHLYIIAIVLILFSAWMINTNSNERFFTSTQDCLNKHCLADPKYLCMQYCYNVGEYLRADARADARANQ